MSYFLPLRLPLKEPKSAMPMMTSGITISGVQSKGRSHMPQKAMTTARNTGTVAHHGQGPVHFGIPRRVGDLP